MIRTGLTIASAVAVLFAPPPYAGPAARTVAPQQGSDLARRVTSSPDGLVKMTYAVRDGICGDGRSFIADAASSARGLDVWFSDGMFLSTSVNDLGTRCTRGPARLLLVVRGHRVIDVQPFVGPSSAATERAGTDLGSVPVRDVASYMLDLAATGRDDNARDAMLAASIADSVRIAAPLASMARNRSLESSVREQALRWLGRVALHEGDRDAMRVARAILEDRDDQTDVRERAIRVIGEEDADGSSYLRSVYARLDRSTLRERVIRVVGENRSKSDLDWVRGIALDQSERSDIRERAVRVIGEESDSRSLRALYDRLDDQSLRERVIRMAGDAGDAESRRWLREVVRDTTESAAVRDRAVRSLADAAAATSELASLYDIVRDRAVRERIVNVLAERGDRAARDKLRSIATNDPDEDLRRRATKKLGSRE